MPTGNHLEDIFYRNSPGVEAIFADTMLHEFGTTDADLALTREIIADHNRDERRAARKRMRRERLERMFPAAFMLCNPITPMT